MEPVTPRHILVVDDDPGTLRLQRSSLERAGYRVVCAASAAEAIDRIKNDSVDLIVLDYRLSATATGLDFCAELSALGYDTPVIMVTGFSEEGTVIQAMRAGVRDFILKSPAYLDYLPQAVARVLKQLDTERRLADSEAQLRQAQKLEAVGALAGGVAHEFNNLLQAIQAYTRFGMEGLADSDPRFQDLQQVLNASNRAAALTRQLLGFGRRQAVVLANIDPNQLVTDLVKMVRPLIGENVTIDVKLGAGVGTVYADAGTFQQLLMNLCVNARDAMPDGGTLLIRTEDLRLSRHYCDVYPDVEPGRYLALSVSDTGTGMPPEVVEHIFEPFFTTKGVGKGTGLGLAQVYGVVQQHHGVIRVYSEVGRGTTFKIYLPTAEVALPQEEDSTPPAAAGGAETILIAEDEPLVRELYARILGKAGYRLLTATNGREGWDVFQAHENEIDLLVLDVMMPEMGGRELHRRIQQVRPEIPVIFASGYDPETAQARFVEDACHPYIQKPFDPDLLLGTVRQMLDREAACPAR